MEKVPGKTMENIILSKKMYFLESFLTLSENVKKDF